MSRQLRKIIFLLIFIGLALNACQINPSAGTLTQLPTAEGTPIPSPLERDFKFYADNPVLTLGQSGSWESGLLDPGAVVFHDDKFNMFYNAIPHYPAQGAVGYATSPDGIDWLRNDTKPIFTVEDVQWLSKSGNIQANSVIMEDDTWVLYFTASNSITSLTGVVGRATASSPTGPWSVDPEPVLKPGESGEWDAGNVGHVDVIKNNKGYIMYYSNPGGIGRATSPDGKHWEKYNDPNTMETKFAKSDPVVKKFAVEDPNVAQTSWGWAMVYLSNNALNYAISMDGINWLDTPDNPIISLPEKRIWYSSLVIHNNKAYLFFEVGTGSGENSKSSPYLATWEEIYSH
jgi:hypothetical protein